MSKRSQSLQALQLNSDATLDEVEAAYYELVKVWHPDRFHHDQALKEKAEEKTKQINASYQYLIHHWVEPSKSYTHHYSDSKANREKSAQQEESKKQDPEKKEKKQKSRSGFKDGVLARAYGTMFSFLILLGVLFYGLHKANFFEDSKETKNLNREEFLPLKNELEKAAERKLSADSKDSSTLEKNNDKNTFIAGKVFSPVPGASVSYGSRSTAPDIIKAAIACNESKVRSLYHSNSAAIRTVDKNGDTALSWASKQGCLNVVKFLIDKKSNVNHKSKNGFTPLIWANLHKRKKVAKLLVSRGASAPPKYWQKKK